MGLRVPEMASQLSFANSPTETSVIRRVVVFGPARHTVA